jgi:AcrR family transcriptional regulator
LNDVTRYSGGGDPARTLALLWGAQKSPTRGPKPGSSVEQIVRTAIEVADAEGLETLSMRRVAERLGVSAMSLYTYVPGKSELLDLMLDAALGELPRPHGTAGEWRAELDTRAREYWTFCRRHPWVLQISGTRPMLGPNETAWFDVVLRAVSGIGLSGKEMVLVVGLVTGYVRAAAQSAVEAEHASGRTGLSDDEWWAAREPILAGYYDAARYPTLTDVEASGAFEPAEGGLEYNLQHAVDSFEFGLERVLDGIEAFVEARSAH